MVNLAGKKIIITGASKGLGAVSAVALAAQGTTLVLIARDKAKLESVRASCKNSSKHLCLPVDLIELAKIQEAITKALDFLGGIDAVLHVAGGGLGLRSELIDGPDLQRLFTLNVGSAAEINRCVVPTMRQQKSGNLVHVGSIASAEAAGSVGYNTVKAGLAAYVRSLGRELARDQLVVTGIKPGGFLAPENAMERLRANNPDAYKSFIADRLPRKRMGDAQEIIPLLLFLCSAEASMMGGCMVPIDAGEGINY